MTDVPLPILQARMVAARSQYVKAVQDMRKAPHGSALRSDLADRAANWSQVYHAADNALRRAKLSQTTKELVS